MFYKLAMRAATAIAEGCQTLTLYANCVYYLTGSTDPALVGVISSLRAAARATLSTTAVGKLNTNLEGSICCPGGLRDRLILCFSRQGATTFQNRAFLSPVHRDGKVAKPMSGIHH